MDKGELLKNWIGMHRNNRNDLAALAGVGHQCAFNLAHRNTQQPSTRVVDAFKSAARIHRERLLQELVLITQFLDDEAE
jgi:hypothetical protein